ncbi:MAG: M13 family metallopeptidase [Gemmatimonadaceae bacterium]
MTAVSTRNLLFSLAAVLALGACQKKGEGATAQAQNSAAPATLTLDESVLPAEIRFAPSDLDRSRNACTDFYGYVDGKWLAANPIPADRTDWGSFSILQERSLAVRHQIAEQVAKIEHPVGVEKIIGDFWTSGMDSAAIESQGIKPLQPQLDAIAALTDGASVAAYIRTSAAHGENVLFGFGPEADFKNSSMNMAYATQGGLGLPDRGYYFDADKKDKLAAYEKHVATVLALSGEPAGESAHAAASVIAFETRLARASRSREELSRDVSLFYNPMSPAAADSLTPNFSWTTFFTSQGVAVPATFSLANPAFHEEVSTMLGDVPVDSWKAYLRYHTVDDASPYLSSAFGQEYYDFHNRTMLGQKEIQPRWKRVLRAIEGETGEAMGQLYVRVAFPAQSKARMETLVQNLRQALKARIEMLAWMSPETKKKALDKWAAFTPKIGYPGKWRDWNGLTTSHDSYLGNALAADAFNYRWELGKIGKPVDRTEWNMTPQTVDAYYNPLQNEIVFPAAILQPPFFDPTAGDAVNYGGIGAVIGHEMTHGYDDQGSRFGPTGNFENWWTPADARAFAARTDKLVRQFNAYEALPGLRVNGRHTLGENIADLGGLATAYDAMKLVTANTPDPMTGSLTRDQRFFLSFGTIWRDQFTPELTKVLVASNEHAPGKFRAIGPPSDLPAFAAAFHCKPGDPMVRSPAQRVEIW